MWEELLKWVQEALPLQNQHSSSYWKRQIEALCKTLKGKIHEPKNVSLELSQLIKPHPKITQKSRPNQGTGSGRGQQNR